MIAMLRKNSERSGYRYAPVVREAELSEFLVGQHRSAQQTFDEVPPSITLRAGFWLALSRPIGAANALLVSTSAACTSLRPRRGSVVVYRSERYRAVYIGSTVDGADGVDYLLPMAADDFPPLDVRSITFIGRVVAAR